MRPYHKLLSRELELLGDEDPGVHVVFRAALDRDETDLADFLIGLHGEEPDTHKVVVLGDSRVRADALAAAVAKDSNHPALIEGEDVYFFGMEEVGQQVTEGTDAIFFSRHCFSKADCTYSTPLPLWGFVLAVILGIIVLCVLKDRLSHMQKTSESGPGSTRSQR